MVQIRSTSSTFEVRGIPPTAVGGWFRSFLHQARLKFAESHQLPRFGQKSDTTGFSRVEYQLCAIPSHLFHLETPPTLVVWSFNSAIYFNRSRWKLKLHATKVGGVSRRIYQALNSEKLSLPPAEAGGV